MKECNFNGSEKASDCKVSDSTINDKEKEVFKPTHEPKDKSNDKEFKPSHDLKSKSDDKNYKPSHEPKVKESKWNKVDWNKNNSENMKENKWSKINWNKINSEKEKSNKMDIIREKIFNEKLSEEQKIESYINGFNDTIKQKIEKDLKNLVNYGCAINAEEFFMSLIKECFISIKNETKLLDDSKVNQLGELPQIIYRNVKDKFEIYDKNFNKKEFQNKIENIYGFIYLAKNQANQNKKVYVGQSVRNIEQEWGEIFSHGKSLRKERIKNPAQIISARYIHNAIAKYPDDAWDLKLIDIAYDKSELDYKEIYYISPDAYDSMNPEKGYNLTTGGRTGGRLSERTKSKVSDGVTEAWNKPGYKERLRMSQKESWENEVRRERTIKAQIKSWDSEERREKASEATTETWRNNEVREQRIKGIKEASEKVWDNPTEEMLRNLENLHQITKKDIKSVEVFLKDIKNTKNQKEFLPGGPLFGKYEIKSHMTLNTRIKEILGRFGVKNHGEAHRFFYDRSLDEVLKSLDNPKAYNIFRDPFTKQFFVDVLNSEKGKDLHEKYKVWHKQGLITKIKRIVGKHDINNYTELKNFLQDYGVDEGLKLLLKKS